MNFNLTLCLLLVACLLSARAGDKPNIIFIMADDVGYNDLSAYGQTLFPTPHTDRLADEGVRLTAAYSPSSVCSPTRYAVVTGTDPFRRLITSHVLFNAEPLVIRKAEPTIASLLQEAGYATGVIGKWHLGLGDTLPRDINNPGRGPNQIGFDYSFLVPDGHNMHPRYYHENGEIVGGAEPSFDSTLVVQSRVGLDLLQNNQVGTWEDRRPDNTIGAMLADKVDEFIEKHADGPFFLYYPTCSVHSPIAPDPRFVGKSGIGPFGDFVMEFDWAVGRVMEKLEELGLAENTLLIVTSDNGGLSNREISRAGVAISESVHRTAHPWRSQKGSMYEGGHRVPFIARWPGQISEGSVSDTYLSLVDLTATAARLAGVELPEESALDSFDMLPALKGDASPREFIITGTRGMSAVSIRQGDWKLISRSGGADFELYHLGNDPQESNNLIEQETERFNHLQALLDRYFIDGASRPGASATGRTIQEILAEREERNQKTEKVLMKAMDVSDAPEMDRQSYGALAAEEYGEAEPFVQGARLFTDRSYRLLEVPDELKGSYFIPADLSGSKSVSVSRAGTVWVLTPSTEINRDSQQKNLKQQGFHRISLLPFPLWNRNPGNHVSVFEKKVSKGEEISFSQWAVPLFWP